MPFRPRVITKHAWFYSSSQQTLPYIHTQPCNCQSIKTAFKLALTFLLAVALGTGILCVTLVRYFDINFRLEQFEQHTLR